MVLRKRDFGFLLVVGGVLIVLILATFREKPKGTPDNAQHRLFREAMARGERREVVEKGCEECHSKAARPLPASHPPKEQCLICHPLLATK